METSVNLSSILSIVFSKIKLIILITLITGIIGSFYTFKIMKTEYKSSIQLIVNQEIDRESFINNEVQANIQLVNTYNEIIKSPFILESVTQKIGNKYTVLELISKIKVSNETNSQIINISAETESPKEASIIVSSVAETFKQKLPEVIKTGQVTILSNSEDTIVSTKANPILYVILFIFLGFSFGIFLVLFLYILDTRVTTEDDIKSQFDIYFLGSVSHIKNKK